MQAYVVVLVPTLQNTIFKTERCHFDIASISKERKILNFKLTSWSEFYDDSEYVFRLKLDKNEGTSLDLSFLFKHFVNYIAN